MCRVCHCQVCVCCWATKEAVSSPKELRDDSWSSRLPMELRLSTVRWMSAEISSTRRLAGLCPTGGGPAAAATAEVDRPLLRMPLTVAAAVAGRLSCTLTPRLDRAACRADRPPSEVPLQGGRKHTRQCRQVAPGGMLQAYTPDWLVMVVSHPMLGTHLPALVEGRSVPPALEGDSGQTSDAPCCCPLPVVATSWTRCFRGLKWSFAVLMDQSVYVV
jgi:hypothetical protein